MPGLVGLITKMPPERSTATLALMVESVRHEAFYTTGTWVDAAAGVYAGWTARKHSFADQMPICNERGDVVLLFSGEEYPQSDTVLRLKERGHAIDACAPASYLVHLAEEDSRFPVNLNGRFHGLLVDKKSRTARLFNDRYGIHRLYYHETPDAFYFASEAKAILEVCPELRTIDARGLGEFVSCGCVLENRTLFSGILVLPPGAAWEFRAGTLERKALYFQPREWEEQEVLEPEAYYHELRDTFARTLPLYFSGSERIGMSLTGGLDSRIIMAWQKESAGSLPCYSFGGMFRECQDVRIARDVARTCGQPHAVIPVEREFLSRFAHYAERTVYLTDGCVDVSHSPDLFVNERAATIAPVRMTGNYGGEVLRQVRAFKPMPLVPAAFSGELAASVETSKATYRGLLTGHPLSFAVFKQAPWHHYGLLSLEQTQLALRSPYLDNAFVRTVFRAPKAALQDNNVSLRLIAEGNRSLGRIPTDRGLSAGGHQLTGPLVHAFQEFTFKSEYAYDYGMPQSLARVDHFLSRLRLERLFLGRHKFYHFRFWYRGPLAQYVRDMLLDSRTLSRPYLNRRGLESMVRGHLKGDQNHTLVIHKALTLELLHRQLIDAA